MTDLDNDKRYTVNAIGLEGDVHGFASDNPERAANMYDRFLTDLSDVQRSEELKIWMNDPDA